MSSPNLAYNAKVEASSFYDKNFKPSFAVDDNNGTLWRPKGMGEEWLKIDLGKVQKIQTIWTQWEYGTQYYQYRIETSSDGTHWQLFADRSRNLHAGSPKIDVAPVVKDRNVPVKARYVKITFLGCQKQGYPGALWNVKVFSTLEDRDNFEWPAPKVLGESGDELIHITADDFQVGDTIWYIPNHGVVSGGFEHEDGLMVVQNVEGTKALPFDSATIFASDFPMPELWCDNVPYHLEATLYNPTIQLNECVADFTSSHDELEKIMLVNGTEPRCGVMNHYGWYEDVGYKEMKTLEGRWQHVVVDFDGRIEKVWINDVLISEKDIQIMVKPVQRVLLGRNAEREWPFTGYLHSLTLIRK